MRKGRVLGGLLVLIMLAAAPVQAAEPFRYPEATYGTSGQLKYVNRVPVVIASGTPQEIGETVGSLALKPGLRAADYPQDILKSLHMDLMWPLLVKSGDAMFKHFPAAYQTELDEMGKAAKADHQRLVVGNTMFDLKNVFACSAVLVEKDRSATGGPMLARNLDYPSLGYINEYSLVTVYRPKGKHAFASVGFPGLVGVVSGMNDAGLTVAVLEVMDAKAGEPKFNIEGVPYQLCLRKMLEECATIAEAKKLLESMPRTVLLNIAVADPNGVAVFEMSPKHVVERCAESGVCTCANHFCTEEMRPEHPADPLRTHERYDTLAALRSGEKKYTPDDLRKQLDLVNLGALTLQTMVFEPATRRLHLAYGKLPASQGKLRCVDLAPLFKGE
jgi:isopenicillin-N N-acyltransferase like protein